MPLWLARHREEVKREREEEVDRRVGRACAPPADGFDEICTKRPAGGARQTSEQGEQRDSAAGLLTVETAQSRHRRVVEARAHAASEDHPSRDRKSTSLNSSH